MKGYKAFDRGLKCKDFQFKEGKEYTHNGDVAICASGFHFCENPLDTLNYYNLCDSEFTDVEAIGKTMSHNEDSKIVTDKIKIGFKLDLPAFIKASFNFLWEKCKDKDNKASGGYSKLAASGYSSQLAASGDSSQLAASGDSSKLAASGDSSKLAASGGYSKLAASGYSSKLELNGQNSVGAAIGIASRVKGKKGNWIVLAEYDNDYKPICVKATMIDGKIIKEDIWYILKNGEFVEV